MKTDLSTGATITITIPGQDGSYHAKLLLAKGYAFHGIKLALIEACRVHRVPRLIFLGNSYIYPRLGRSRCARTACSEARSNRPTRSKPSPRLPG